METEYIVLTSGLRIISLVCGFISVISGLIAISNTKASYKFYPLIPIWPFVSEWFTEFGNASRVNFIRFGIAAGIFWAIAWVFDGRGFS